LFEVGKNNNGQYPSLTLYHIFVALERVLCDKASAEPTETYVSLLNSDRFNTVRNVMALDRIIKEMTAHGVGTKEKAKNILKHRS
jgi:hypothetical protein